MEVQRSKKSTALLNVGTLPMIDIASLIDIAPAWYSELRGNVVVCLISQSSRGPMLVLSSLTAVPPYSSGPFNPS